MAKISVFFLAGYVLVNMNLCKAGKRVRRWCLDETAAVTMVCGQKSGVSEGFYYGADGSAAFETDLQHAFDIAGAAGEMPETLHLEARDGLMEQMDRFYSEYFLAKMGYSSDLRGPADFRHRGYLKVEKGDELPFHGKGKQS